MIDISKKFSVHIMHTKPAETDDLILTDIRAQHDASVDHVRHNQHGLPVWQSPAS